MTTGFGVKKILFVDSVEAKSRTLVYNCFKRNNGGDVAFVWEPRRCGYYNTTGTVILCSLFWLKITIFGAWKTVPQKLIITKTLVIPLSFFAGDIAQI